MADSSAPSILDTANRVASVAADLAPLLTGDQGSRDDRENEKELELETPFGKVELEFEPKTTKKEESRLRREQKAAARALKKASKQAKKEAETAGEAAAEVVQKARSGRGGKILLGLAIIVAVSAFIGVAWWLFA